MAFTIRRIYDDILPVNKKAIEQIITITRNQIDDMDEEYFAVMRSLVKKPVYRRMHHMLFIADDGRGDTKGFALMSYAADLKFCFLDLIALRRKKIGRGVGSALYERLREEARILGSEGIFLECMSDNKEYFSNQEILRQAKARLKFYEQYNARPIIGTNYEKNTLRRYHNPYFLLFDPLDKKPELQLSRAKKIIRAILLRKYDPPCSITEINRVLKSMKDDPLLIHEHKYIKTEIIHQIKMISDDKKIALVYNDGHDIHHIRERGYVESPVRIKSILKELNKTNIFVEYKAKNYPNRQITAVHDKAFFNYLKTISLSIGDAKTVYPDVFPIRAITRPPQKLITQAGCYCTDVYSPINRNSFATARSAVNCALRAADLILEGRRLAYALVRPPGHHAGINFFGGFCYLNSTATAAHYMSEYGTVAILDLDYHHGNGQQDIFYQRKDVLTISIHGDPDFEYPHFSGFKEETGKDAGEGYNINYPLPEKITGLRYQGTLKKAIKNIRQFDPDFLVIALGLDTSKGDPTGTWLLEKNDFFHNGRLIGRLKIPTLIIQEGGYKNQVLGINARHFFTGLWEGSFNS